MIWNVLFVEYTYLCATHLLCDLTRVFKVESPLTFSNYKIASTKPRKEYTKDWLSSARFDTLGEKYNKFFCKTKYLST